MTAFRRAGTLSTPHNVATAPSSSANTTVRMTIPFIQLITPLNGGVPRTKRDVVRAILDIVPEDRLFQVAEALTKHEKVDNYNVIRRVAHHLAAAGALHKLRTLSKPIIHYIASLDLLRGVYSRLYVSPTYTNPSLQRDKVAFFNIAYGCTELVASFHETFGNHEYPPGVIFQGNTLHGRNSAQVNDWKHVFEQCPNLTTLTVVTGGCPTAMMWNRTSTALTALRTAFEEAGLKNVTTLRLTPADPVYIGQFKWNGPAYGVASPLAAAAWSSIRKLELQVLPLAKELSKLDRIQAIKMFNAWLRSFAPRLEVLKMCYLGKEEGAHPFALLSGLDIKASGQPDMKTALLKELWLGRVANVDDFAPLLEAQAPCLECYRVLTCCENPLGPVAFKTDSPTETWDTRYLQITEHNEPAHYGQRSVRSNTRPSYDVVVPQTPMRHAQHSFTEPSTSTFISLSGRPSISTVQTKSSAFPTLVAQESQAWTTSTSAEEQSEVRRSRKASLPLPSKTRRRGSSGFSSIFKFKSRPKSDPVQKHQIVVLGETPVGQVPRGFLMQDQTVAAEILRTRYTPDTIEDLTALKLANQQQIGQFAYSPGTLFQAGTGARLPTSRRLTLEGGLTAEGQVGSTPTPEQIRMAFDRMALTTPTRAGMPTDQHFPSLSPSIPIARGKGVMSPQERDEYWNRYQPLRPAYAPPNINYDDTPGSQPSSKRSWETIDRVYDRGSSPSSNRVREWESRTSVEERCELPVSNSRRNSKRMSQLEDVIEEDYVGVKKRLRNMAR